VNIRELELQVQVMVNLHNLGAVREEVAKTADQLASMLNSSFDDTRRALDILNSESYVGKVVRENCSWYYLTGKGIVTVCAMFT
jgi:CTP-dependent riboflavin kinase